MNVFNIGERVANQGPLTERQHGTVLSPAHYIGSAGGFYRVKWDDGMESDEWHTDITRLENER